MKRRFLSLLALVGACAPTPAQKSPPPVVVVAPSPSVSASAVASAPLPEPEPPVATIKPEEGVGVAPGPSGHLGAWLALGPFAIDGSLADMTAYRPPVRDENGKPTGATLDDHALRPGDKVDTRADKTDGKKLGHVPAAWRVASSGDGAIDLEKVFVSKGKPFIGYLGGVLRVPKRAKLLLLVGSDDGCEVLVDGKSVFVRDASRPQRDDDDLVPLDLDAGDHPILFKLRQRDSGWAFRARLVDETFRPPHGVRLLLPKAGHEVAESLARAMSWVRVIREPKKTGYQIATLVRYPEGAPLDVSLPVYGSVLQGTTELVASHGVGSVPIGPRSVEELSADIGFVEEPSDAPITVKIDVAGRTVDGALLPKKPVRLALAHARDVLSKPELASLPSDVRATLEHLESRLSQQVTKGDLDGTSQLADAAFLDAFAADAEQGKDPIAARKGVMRLAHVARADGLAQPVAVYVPSGKLVKKPLYVGLHGMNGGPMSMLRVFFGGDDEKKSMGELDRAMASKPTLDAYVIAPHAHGNAMYRQLGEEEVMDAIAWARARWPDIDPDRVYVTGFSMGGIGAASIPFHHPDVFAAAQPLCGYHSYFIRRDVAGRPKRPWEQFLLEERSNVSWVDNGARLPLWIVHGTHDLPEENSGVLIEAYEKKKYSIQHDHPDLGHDVWGWAYDKLQHVGWFAGKKRNAHPRSVQFRTSRPRWGDDAWVHVDRLGVVAGWGIVDARVIDKKHVTLKLEGIDALHLDRDPVLLDAGALTVTVNGAALAFAEGAPLVLHREPSGWTVGAPPDDGPRKAGRITGPIRDVWSDPLRVIYGTEDPTQTQVNLEVARAFAAIRWGTDVRYPILKDTEIDPAEVPDKATILVGNAKSNRVLRALEPSLPIQVKDGTVTFAGKTYTGKQLGAAFVVPHPKAKEQYLLVIEGADALGTFRALSLPELLPDFVIWDERLAPARGQSLLAFGSVVSAGYFDLRWRPPTSSDDPFSKLPSAKSEKDATPYLP